MSARKKKPAKVEQVHPVVLPEKRPKWTIPAPEIAEILGSAKSIQEEALLADGDSADWTHARLYQIIWEANNIINVLRVYEKKSKAVTP